MEGDAYNVTVPTQLYPLYATVEVLCAVAAILENFLVILVFSRSRRLRKVTNYYVISLAAADLLVGLVGIPSALSTSVGLPRNFHLCVLMHSVLLLLCTGSILSLVAITVDRFWAIVYPLTYEGEMTERRASGVIVGCWCLAGAIGLLPSAGWNKGQPPEPRCFFMEVMDLRYLSFLFFATMVAPLAFMATVYAVIYRVVQKQVGLMSLQFQSHTHAPTHAGFSGTATAALLQKSAETKAAKNIAVIVVFFVVSWLPLYTINTICCFCPRCEIPQQLIDCSIVLSHLNSVWNPALYAWAMRDFRHASVDFFVGVKRGLLATIGKRDLKDSSSVSSSKCHVNRVNACDV